VYAIDATNGTQILPTMTTPEAITAGVTVADGKIFVMSGANEWLTVFDETSHAQLYQRHFYTWTDPTTLGTAASVDGSKVFLTGLDSQLHILNEDTTDAAPPAALGAWAQNTPVEAATKVFVGTNDGRVVAFDRGGTKLWDKTQGTGAGIVTSPIYVGGMTGPGVLLASDTDKTLYALDPTTGNPLWHYTTGGGLFAAPAVVSNRIVLGSDDKNIYFLEPGAPDNRPMPTPPPVSHTYGQQPTQQQSPDPVGTSTGNYTTSATDVTIPGRGIPVGFARTYNSLDASTSGPLGYGWTYNAAGTLAAGSGTATIRWGDGHTDTYTGTGPTYAPPADGHDTLSAAPGGGWDLQTARSHLRYHFDPAGKLTTITDASGNATTLGYDTSGRLATETDSSSHTITLGYDPSSRINAVTDPLGRHWTYTYDGAGNLATAADNAAHTWRYGYDPAHHLQTITDPDGNLVISNTYDAAGRVTKQIDSATGSWTYTYNTGSTVVTDAYGHATTYAYDADYRTTSVTDALGDVTQWRYDEHSNLAALIDPTGRTQQFHYDQAGNLTASLDALGHKTAYAYDTANNLTSIEDLKGNTTTLAYDAANRLTDTTSPAGVHTHVTYRSDGQPDTVTDGNGKVTHFGYDATGMPTSVTDPLSRTTQVAFDADGQVTSTTDALLRSTGYHYDAAGRLDVS